ncbi:glycoside hydrolase [Mycena rebaudengoi]|nr:glycoside hydrolase [Mycena rebaudengoi]
MTQDSCVSTCDTQGFIYGGPQHGNECWCGNSLDNGLGLETASSECSMQCAGDSSQICGAGYRINLFRKISAATSSSTPKSVADIAALDMETANATATSRSTLSSASISDIWVTTWDKSKLLSHLNADPINFATPGPVAGADITVDETKTYQTMDGFGASLTDSSAKLLAKLKSTNSKSYETLLHQLFDVSDGAYSAMSNVLRIPLGASDFSETAWSYCDTLSNPPFANFDIDRTPSYVWTVLFDILAINSLIKIYVVPWSPPAWMKDNNNMRGGSISPPYVEIYPTYLLKALQGFQAKGVPIYSIAIQNEPQYSDSSYPSTTIPVATAVTIGRALRDLMNNHGFSGVKILGYDHNFSDAAKYPVQLMRQADNSFAGAAFHCYGGDVNMLTDFRSSYPDKEIHITECSGMYGSDWWSDIKWYGDNLFIGGPERYAKSSMMWNIALDGNGQPMLPGTRSCGTPCRGLVQINSDGTWSLNQEFWAIAHAGKAIAPKDPGGPLGQRIGVSVAGTYSWALRVSAYATARKSPNDKTRYSLVVLNKRDSSPTPQTTTINFSGVQASYTFPVGLTTLSWYA